MNVFLWNARARNGHVEATLNHPFPAQVGGERRFASAVAKRLMTLGAVTQGDRRATVGASGLGLTAFQAVPKGPTASGPRGLSGRGPKGPA